MQWTEQYLECMFSSVWFLLETAILFLESRLSCSEWQHVSVPVPLH